MNIKTGSKNFVLIGLAASLLFTGGMGSASAKEKTAPSHSYELQQVKQETKYSKEVMRALREGLGLDKKTTQRDSEIESMAKVQAMDLYLASFGKKVKGNEVRKAVEEIFFVDLDLISKKITALKQPFIPKRL